MQNIVPMRYFDIQKYRFQYENRTFIVVVNAVPRYIQCLFLVQEHNTRSSTFELKWSMMPRSTKQHAPRILVRPYSSSQWEEIIRMEDVRNAVNIQFCAALYVLGSLSKTYVENDYTNYKSKIIQLQSLLPNTQLLNHLCVIHGRKSVLIEEICQHICSTLKKRSSTIVDVWAGYMPDKANEITFIVITEKGCECPIILDRPIVHRCVNAFSKEAAYVIANEEPLKDGVRKSLRTVINRHTGFLLQKHKNITLISISSMKSTKFNTRTQLCRRPCIVIYVHVKGMVPIDEDTLPTRLDGYDTDIREGAFSPFLYEPNQVSGSIKMGCPIQGPGDNVDDKGNVFGGTLGGFIDHPNFGVCCITSAHVILSPQTMHTTGKARDGWQPPHYYNGICYQPCPPHTFGRVVLAVCKEGTDDIPGVEVVMIKVEDR